MVKERNLFLETVGYSPELKILDFLICFSHFDYSKPEIAKNSKVSYTNLERILPELIKKGLVKKTRKIGKSELYQLNRESPIAKVLIAYHWQIIKTVTHKELGLKHVKVKIPITQVK